MRKNKRNRARRGEGQGELGGALLFVLIISASVLFVAGAAVYGSIQGRKSSTQRVHAERAFYCAETALERARSVVTANIAQWDLVLAGNKVAWYPVTGTCPGTGGYTFSVTMRDNADEFTPAVNNPQSDNDLTVIMDAEAQRGGIGLARVSGIVFAASAYARDYKNQDRLGSRKTGNAF